MFLQWQETNSEAEHGCGASTVAQRVKSQACVPPAEPTQQTCPPASTYILVHRGALPSHISTHNKEMIEKNTDVVLGRTAVPPVVPSELRAPHWPLPSGGPRQTLL